MAVCTSTAWGTPSRHAPTAVATTVTAADPKVPVLAEVILASTSTGTVEKGLEGMQSALSSKVRYLSLKRLSTQTLSIESKIQTIAIPGGQTAELKLEALKDGVATLRVKLPPTDTTYSLAKGKSLYLQAGSHDGGDLWLVLGQPK